MEEGQSAALQGTMFVGALLSITADVRIALAVRQAAVLRLKNLIVYNDSSAFACSSNITAASLDDLMKKRPDKFDLRVSLNDRAFLRENLLRAIAVQPENKLRVQLLEVFYILTRADLNENGSDPWIGRVLQQILNVIQNNNGDFVELLGVIAALRKIYTRFQYADSENSNALRQISEQIIPVVVGVLESILTQISPESHHFENAILTCKEIIKILLIEMRLDISPYLQNRQVFTRLQKCFTMVAGFVDWNQKYGAVMLKAQKWIGRLSVRLIYRYCNPKNPDYKEFGSFYINELAPSLVEAYLNIVKHTCINGGAHFGTMVVQHFAFDYLKFAVSFSNLYSIMKSQLNSFLYDAIFRCFTMTSDEVQAYLEDPVTYIADTVDPELSELGYYDPRSAASNLLNELLRIRTRDTLEPVLQSMFGILQSREANELQRDAAMRIIGNSSELLLSNEQLQETILNLVHSVVLGNSPESSMFFNANPILRSRACWFIARFNELDFPVEVINGCMQCLIHCLTQDSDLVARFEAANAIPLMIKDQRDAMKQACRDSIGTLLGGYFALIQHVGNDEVVTALDRFVHEFDDEIGPYAVPLIKNLIDLFNTTMAKEDGVEEMELCMVMNSVHTINTTIYSVCEVPEIFDQVEPMLAGLIQAGLSGKGMDILEDVLDIISCCVFYNPNGVSEVMWPVLSMLTEAYFSFAGDCLPNMIPAFESYIARNPEIFLARGGHLSILSIVKHILIEHDNRSSQIKFACKILQTMVVFCKDQAAFVAEHLNAIFEMCAGRLLCMGEDVEVKVQTKIEVATVLSLVGLVDGSKFIGASDQLIEMWLFFSTQPTATTRQKKAFVLGGCEVMKSMGRVNNILAEACAGVAGSLETARKEEAAFEEHLFVGSVVSDFGNGQSKFLDIPEGEDFLGDEEDDELLKFEHFLRGVEGQGTYHLEETEAEIESPLDTVDAVEYFQQTMHLFTSH
eukprot:TRINITY_DN2445_c0_g1_i1.p1 TRINITY_DN2445_c0_g1~~TRINITY_DN2445_c0_g1_i1.p1  ORF type:complete len:1019 (+),score=326.35 TRINITY_DN2445_c0_g1_i1:151-3057(+)